MPLGRDVALLCLASLISTASARNPTFNTTIGQESDLRAYNLYAGFIGYASMFAMLGLMVGIIVCFCCKHLPDVECKVDSQDYYFPILTPLCTRLCCPNPPYKITEEEQKRNRFALNLAQEISKFETPQNEEEL